MLFTKRFWRGSTEQIATSGAAAVLTGWTLSFPWHFTEVCAGFLMLYTFCKCVASVPIGVKGSSMITRND